MLSHLSRAHRDGVQVDGLVLSWCGEVDTQNTAFTLYPVLLPCTLTIGCTAGVKCSSLIPPLREARRHAIVGAVKYVM